MSFRDYSITPSANTYLSDGTYIGPNMLRNKVRPALQQLAADGKRLANEISSGGGGSSSWEGVTFLYSTNDVTDRSADVQAALDDADTYRVVLGPGPWWIGTKIIVPEGKHLRGFDRSVTQIFYLPSMDLVTVTNIGITSTPGETGVRVSDLAIDGMKVGTASTGRINGVVMQGEHFLVERVDVINCTGYALWAASDNGAIPASHGRFRDVYASNSNVLFETTNAEFIWFEDMRGDSGDGDIAIEAVFHPLAKSNNIWFINGHFVGIAGSVINCVAIGGDQVGLHFINLHGELTNNLAPVVISGPSGSNEVFIQGCTFITPSQANGGSSNATILGDDFVLYASNSKFVGTVAAVYAASGKLFLDDCILESEWVSSGAAVFGLLADGTAEAHVTGGSITVVAFDDSLANPVSGDVSVSNVALSPVVPTNTNVSTLLASGSVYSEGNFRATGRNFDLAAGDGAELAYDSGQAFLTAANRTGGGGATYIPLQIGGGPVNVNFEAAARIQANATGVSMFSIPAYADDAAAAAGGLEIGGIYRTASALKIRVA